MNPVQSTKYSAKETKEQLHNFNKMIGVPADAALPMPVNIGMNSAVALKAFIGLWAPSMESKVFSSEDREIIIIAASQFNNCLWCVKVHELLCTNLAIDKGDLDEVGKGGLPKVSERHRILAMATKKILCKKGKLSDEDKAFYKKHGLGPTELQEVLSVTMIMMFANYSNHLNDVAENPAAIQSAMDQLCKINPNLKDTFVAHSI
jgi:AhpD family alkylhydroperoxidase